jgi:hypothetical protein
MKSSMPLARHGAERMSQGTGDEHRHPRCWVQQAGVGTGNAALGTGDHGGVGSGRSSRMLLPFSPTT